MYNKKFIIKGKCKTVAKTIRLPQITVERLEDFATKNNISFNSLLIQCITFALDNLKL
ncbi:MAG: hypothetical protein NC485_11390 [Ruminococcus flavefaciens]|nr:hypothetical protein [Ruminococcus flavefaciens]MCM1060506.1 hypothetical protein [Eubacterium sp.]